MNSQKGSQRDKILSLFFGRKRKNKKTESEKIKTKSKKISYELPVEEEHKNEEQKSKKQIDIIIDINKKNNLINENKKIQKTKKTNSDGQPEIEIVSETEKEIIQQDMTKSIDVKIESIEEKDDTQSEIENTIIDTIEQIIEEDLEELDEIEYELKVINDKQEDEVKLAEVEKIKTELQEIIKKLNFIKDKYYSKKEKNPLDIDDKYIYDLVNNYKDELAESNLDKKIKNDIKHTQEYISIIERIISVENTTETLDKQIEEKLDKYEIRDDYFEKMKDEYTDIQDLKDIIDTFNKQQNTIIKSLESKIERSAKISKRIEKNYKIVPDLNKLIESAMIFALSKKIPPTPRGKLIKIAMITSAIGIASGFLTTKETTKEIVNIEYTDFSKDIYSCIKDISTMDRKIDSAFLDINKIRRTLKSEYGEFKNKLDDFDNLLNKLDNVEKK